MLDSDNNTVYQLEYSLPTLDLPAWLAILVDVKVLVVFVRGAMSEMEDDGERRTISEEDVE